MGMMRDPYLYPNTEVLKNKLSVIDIWKVHIFREGNTRTIVTFICQYTESKGFALDTELFEQNSAYVRSALVAASAVFKGLGDKSKPQYLVKIVKDALRKGESA